MSLFKFILTLSLFFCGAMANAQTKEINLKTVAVSYLSWIEFMTLDSGTMADEAYANFYGTAISYENETYKNRFGTISTASAMFGQANGGGTQTAVPYQKSYQSWYGVMAEYKYAYRISAQTTIALGPAAMYREVKWPLATGVQDVKSGSQVNMGALLDFRIRFNPAWELRQTFGTMAFKASTLWSLGIGYKF